MVDLEVVLANAYDLMVTEKRKCGPATRPSKKIILPDPSVRSVMVKYLEKMGEINFDKIFNQHIGYLLFKDFCQNSMTNPVSHFKFYEHIKAYEKINTKEERKIKAREIYDTFVMGELLSNSGIYSTTSAQHVQNLLLQKDVPSNLFEPYLDEIFTYLRSKCFQKFVESDKFTRFCQWKNIELNIQLSMNDFYVHQIIGQGGFGEVYGCHKADTGKMYAMKCLDKKWIKMKQGEAHVLNELKMLSLVSTVKDCPFIISMTYAFHTTDKLFFILDLMNGGNLHYHLSQHGVFSESQMKFYAAEIILGLEHMHRRYIVYRDLKLANILLDHRGHVRISNLCLACDFSMKKPHASVGTYGYMAPEVLSKGTVYDSSADWFSFGCVIYKLLKGNSPFHQHKTKDKHEIDQMKLTMNMKLPNTFSKQLRDMLESLLQRDVNKRLGCCGRGSNELKDHPFFGGYDWFRAYQQRYTPPIIPLRSEVSATDSFDIGSFDDEDTKGIKLQDSDQEPYKNISLVISERWQAEVVDTVFDTVNLDYDKMQWKKKGKQKKAQQKKAKQIKLNLAQHDSDIILHGYIKKLGGLFSRAWQTRYAKLYPNRLELYPENSKPELTFMEQIEEINKDQIQVKNEQCIILKTQGKGKIVLTSSDMIALDEWSAELHTAHKCWQQLLSGLDNQVGKTYGHQDHPSSNSAN